MRSKIKGYEMAKQQSFSDKLKKKGKSDLVTVKVIKAVKGDKGSYKFNEKLVKIEDISKVSGIK